MPLDFVPYAHEITPDLSKPAKGTATRARHERAAAVASEEKRNKALVRKLDGGCRWPRCDCKRLKLRVEVAHLVDKSRLGSNAIENLISLCVAKHQGRPSLHSGDLDIRPLTPTGTRGPCEFYARDPETGKFVHVATERSIGVPETRR